MKEEKINTHKNARPPPSPQHTPPHTCLSQLSHPHNTTTAPLSPSHRAHDTRKSMEHVPNPDERAGSTSRSPQRGDFSIRMVNYHGWLLNLRETDDSKSDGPATMIRTAWVVVNGVVSTQSSDTPLGRRCRRGKLSPAGRVDVFDLLAGMVRRNGKSIKRRARTGAKRSPS